MTFLIGGLSAQQYKSYLNPASDEKKQWKLSHWVAHFHLSRYPAIAVIVNRLAFFVMHRFSNYPNNAYLLQKFKSHDFSQIDSQEKYKIVKEIFTCFKQCTDIQSSLLDKLEAALDEIESRLADDIEIASEDAEIESEDEDSEKKEVKETENKNVKANEKESEEKLKAEAELKQKELEEKRQKEIDTDKKELEESNKKEVEARQKEIEEAKQKELEEAKTKKETDPSKLQQIERAKKRREIRDARKKQKAEEAQNKKDLAEAKKKELEEAKKNKEAEDKLASEEDAEPEILATHPLKIEVGSDNKDDGDVSGEKEAQSDEDIFDPQDDELEQIDAEKESQSQDSVKKVPVIVLKDVELNLPKDPSTDTEKGKLATDEEEKKSPQQQLDHSEFSEEEGVLDLTSDEERSESDGSEIEQSDQTSIRLKNKLVKFSLSLSVEDKEKAVGEELKERIIPLSKEVTEIVSQDFPLEVPASINNLFDETEKDGKALAHYRKNLKEMLHFENQLRMEKSTADDERYEDYMLKFDGAFQRAWGEAYQQCAELNREFTKAFPQPVQLSKAGEVICSMEQLQWVSHTISERFPAIYRLAFDAPSLDIYQSHQMGSLARAIFVGIDAHEKAPEINSGCCIYIQETIGKSTPLTENDPEYDPLLKSGSFIYTYFVGPTGKLTKEARQIKKQLQGLAKSYVKDWLKLPGATLQFGNTTIASGQFSEDISASEWVSYVRDAYTLSLKKMSPEQLKEEIQKAYKCPFISLIAKTYADEVDEKEWLSSTFPKTIMRAIFEKAIDKAQGNVDVQQGIHQTIDDACFADPQDVKDLAQLASASESIVESLIRIRVFYMICCLGQNATESAVHGLKKRADTMRDPSVDGTENDQGLVCSSHQERVLAFDETFDELTVSVKTLIKDPNKVHAVAQAESVLNITSISQPATHSETSNTELKELSFSLYSSPAQTRYLVAQVAPQTLVDNMDRLAKELPHMDLCKKAKQFQSAKEENAKSNSVWNKAWNFKVWSTPFDFKSYQDITKDEEGLDAAIEMAQKLATYLNTLSMVEYTYQLPLSAETRIESSRKAVREHFKNAITMLQDVYFSKNENGEDWNRMRLKIEQLSKLVNADPAEMACSSDSDDDLTPRSSGSASPDLSEDEDEVIRNVIGKTAGTAQKTFFNHVYDYTFGLAFNETTQVKYLSWKVERYEDLILNIQKKVEAYIDSHEELGNVNTLIREAGKTIAPEWMRKLLPILKFSQKGLRDDMERMNPDYLEQVRKSYTDDMLQKLRDAANWAKAHPSMPGVEHVDAICYQLYATMDINDRCRRIFKTFLKLGQQALGKKHERLPSDPLYAMIDGLYEANEKINAVPFEAKAPFLKQVCNSARGHFNGVYGMTTFDPNMQSNPTHVFFNKIVKEKGEEAYQVKDIAMGSPTIEDGSGSVQIAPEFEGMLRYYQKNDLVHLYINNQDFTNTSWVKGFEANRCQRLHDLAENDFKDTLYVITLNQNTSFYKQKYDINKRLINIKRGIEYVPDMNAKNVKDALILDLLTGKSKHYLPASIVGPDLLGWMTKEIDDIHQKDFDGCDEFEDEEVREKFIQHFHTNLRKHAQQCLETSPSIDGETFGYSPYYPGAAEFKEQLLAQVFDGDPHETGNLIPADLVAKFDLRTWSDNAVDQIHNDLFAGRKDLTAAERRIFIRLFYQNLSRKILIETKADSYNASCKDRIDRGAATDAEDFAYLAILADCMKDPRVVEFFQMLVFVRAIIVRKRTIIEERLERLIETVKFMLDHQKELQKLHASLFPDVQITIDQFNLDLDNGEDLEISDKIEIDSKRDKLTEGDESKESIDDDFYE